ncbi:MAG: DUF1800 domain-containing protein [Pseudomonadota bacterium]
MNALAENSSFAAIAPLRFGYGRRAGDAALDSPAALLAQIPIGAARRPPFAGEGSPPRIAALRSFILEQRAARQAKDAEAIEAARKGRRSLLQGHYLRDAHARVLWSVTQPEGFFERLAFFWADHFTVSMAKSSLRHLVGPFEAEAIRPHLGGDFATLLKAASLHPAMLLYLDQDRSMGPASEQGQERGRGLNENLAREIIELHTLGVAADYSQRDVRQFAELLTGVSVNHNQGVQIFSSRLAEPGSEVVLGERYGDRGIEPVLQVLEDLAHHPATAQHLARKLAVHFLSDDPPDDVVQHLTATYLENDTRLMPVYRALLEHPAAWQTFGQKVRQPFDLVVTSLRISLFPGSEASFAKPKAAAGEGMMMAGSMAAIGRPADYRWTLRPLARMAQLPWNAPGPDGWKEQATAWISPQGLAERLAWAERLAAGPLRRASPKEVTLRAFAGQEPDRLALLALEAGSSEEARTIILASPEFQRR